MSGSGNLNTASLACARIRQPVIWIVPQFSSAFQKNPSGQRTTLRSAKKEWAVTHRLSMPYVRSYELGGICSGSRSLAITLAFFPAPSGTSSDIPAWLEAKPSRHNTTHFFPP